MTKLIVRPIDPKAAGSYRERKQFMEVARKLNALRAENNDIGQVLAAYDAVETLLLPRLRTDDETTVEEALEQLSAEEYDQLLGAVTFGGEEVIPPVNASDSSSPSEVTETALTG